MELGEYAKKRGFNLGQAEKDYYQNLLLFIIYEKVAKELVFKGGTALSKCYGLSRFSEDLDFSSTKKVELLKIIETGVELFSLRCNIKDKKEHPNGESFKLKIEGPLYKQNERTLCSVSIDVSYRDKILIAPQIRTIGHHMDIIPSFDVYVMNETEIVAEKIHAIMARHSARDLYDLNFLLNKNVEFDKKIIDTKLALRKMEFDILHFEKRCLELKPIWENELKSLVRNVCDFDEVKNNVIAHMKKL